MGSPNKGGKMVLLLFVLLALLVFGAGVVFKALEIAIIVALALLLIGFFTGRSGSNG